VRGQVGGWETEVWAGEGGGGRQGRGQLVWGGDTRTHMGVVQGEIGMPGNG